MSFRFDVSTLEDFIKTETGLFSLETISPANGVIIFNGQYYQYTSTPSPNGYYIITK